MDPTKSPEASQRPSWFTDELIKEVLQKCEDDNALIIKNVDVKRPLGKGENNNSVIHKIKATYITGRGHQETKHFIMKATPENLVMQTYLKETNLYGQEIKAYSKLFPAMARLTDKPLVSPSYYPTYRGDVLILEDMSSRGFKMADRKKGLDMSHSLLVVKTLARFHGLSFGVVERDPAIVDHFSEVLFSNRTKHMHSSYLQHMFSSLASLVETWPGFERFSEKIRRHIDGLLDNLIEEISPEKNAFNVINHGDCWVNNMLFRYNEDTQEPEDVCFLDLQIVRYGSPALDLQYFFVTSLEDGIREEHEDALLEVYHKELCETLRSVTLQPTTYSFEDLSRDFQDKAVFGFYMGCWILCAVVTDSEEAFDMDSLTADSLKENVISPLEKMFVGKRFKDVFKKFLLYYESKNVI